MDIKEVFKQRRSVRKFKDKAIDDEVISEILCAANTAPCTDTCNYYFGVIKDPAVKKQIGESTVFADWVAKAPVIFVCCSNIEFDVKDIKPGSYTHKGLAARYGEEVLDFFMSADNSKSIKTLMQSSPAYIAAQHIILSANSYGLKGCLVDFINVEQINKILNIPDDITCELIVPVGYPDENPKPIKVNQSNNIFFYKWNN